MSHWQKGKSCLGRCEESHCTNVSVRGLVTWAKYCQNVRSSRTLQGFPLEHCATLYFVTYNEIKCRFMEREKKKSLETSVDRRCASKPGAISSIGFNNDVFIPFLAGFSAEAMCIVFWLPVDNICQRLMIQDICHRSQELRNGKDSAGSKAHPWKFTTPGTWPKQRIYGTTVVAEIFCTQGLRGFLRGFTVSALSYVPQSASTWAAYESSKRLMLSLQREKPNYGNELSLSAQIMAGGFAGFVGTLISQPLDTIKTRIQTQMGTVENHPTEANSSEFPSKSKCSTTIFGRHRSMGILNHGRTIWRVDGLKGFYRGLWPRMSVNVPYSALGFIIYEYAVSFSQRR